MRRHWFRLLGLAALATLGVVSQAQDFPTLKGDNGRVGRNGNPGTSGPGRTLIDWWRPNPADVGTVSADIDNLDLANIATTGSVFGPTDVTQWAEAPYIPARYSNVNPAVNPPYRYMFGTPSLSATQPEVPQNAFEHATFEWSITSAQLGAAPRGYALYVWLPIGSTITGTGNQVFSQRYYVYEIFHGTNKRDVQVVDTYAAGFGLSRLGNGGFFTTKLYEYDGATPIRIRLHNTIVRRDDGSLTESYISGISPLVYADAVFAVPEYGKFKASPTVSDIDPTAALDIRTVAAVNKVELDPNFEGRTITRGQVSSYGFNGLPAPNNTLWAYTPVEDSELSVYQDNTSAGVSVGAGWTAQNTPTGFRGTDYLSAAMTDQPVLASQVEFSPTLDDGSYEIWAWVPGSTVGLTLSRDVTYEIVEGVTVTTVTVDQDAARGWVRIGTRRYVHNQTSGDTLKVRVVNLGAASELGRLAYADTIRFVGSNDLAINSTPVQAFARVNVPAQGGLQERPVVIVAAENGRIYCLDAEGNADGTTNVYWTYPSTPDPDNTAWTDPNAVNSEDGGVAEMPTGFDLSSALVQRIDGDDYLFIASTNGRVYSIEMAGRGDMDLALRKPGTTRRDWTYPNDFPAQSVPSALGPSIGSVAFADTSAGPTLFVPTFQGRLYALDARGNGNKTTSVRWAFPEVDQPTLGACQMTPAVENDTVYCGFDVDANNVGRLYAFDVANGNIRWQFNGTTAWDTTGSNTFITASNFRSGPCIIPASELGGGQPDTLVVANDNLWITALDAGNGNLLWTTRELESPVLGNLTYTPQTVYNNAAALQTFPCVLVPTTDGRFASLFAETAVNNVLGNGNRLAWFYDTDSGDVMETSLAVGRGYMYGADTNGTLLAFDDVPGDAYGGIWDPPGQEGVPPNDPNSIPYRGAKIKFVNRDIAERFRLQETDTNFPTYAQATNNANAVNRNAFEWGETVYAMVYDFPANFNNDPGLRRAQIEYRFAAEGIALRNLQVSSKAFQIIGGGNPPTEPITGMRLDGVTILSFVVQGNGANALPPGPGSIGFSISAQFNAGQGFQSVAVDPANSRRTFNVANPIGVAVQFNNAGVPLNNFSIAYTTDPTDPEAQVNGSVNVPATTKSENLILSNVGQVQHGGQGNSLFAVYDRSLMTLLRGPGRGLDLVRATRSDMTWMGGSASVYKPINSLAYPNFEDLPTNYPNTSVDYPNIRRENFTITKDKFGVAENPLYNAISLVAPDINDVGNPISRILNATPFDLEVNVPRFQPTNTSTVNNSNNAVEQAGYYGRVLIYVDGTGNGTFDNRGRVEAYRWINVGAAVPADEKMVVGRTELDLGSLAQGTGFSPLAPWLPASPYSPSSGQYQNLFQTFQVYNEGNSNLLNVRIAKGTDQNAVYQSWGLASPDNNSGAWIDTTYNLWGDIDERFALNNLSGNNNVLLQKSRVGDRNPIELLTNPVRRVNANLGVAQGALYPAQASNPPRLSVTIPLGTPIGTYITDIRIIEDENSNESLTFVNNQPVETFTDPTIRLRFNVREARLTNGFSLNTSPMVHNGLTGAENFLHRNAQPTAMRDLGGQLVLAFASTHPGFNDPQPAQADTNNTFRIFVGSLNGNVPTSVTFGQNPLKDLMDFLPTGSRFFRQAAGPLPQLPDNDPAIFGPDVVAGTATYGQPAFGALGGIDPFSGSSANPFIAYVGDAQVQTAAGRSLVSKVFIQALNIADDGTVSLNGGPVAISDNPNMLKTKPMIVQVGSRVQVIYTGTVNGQSRLYSAFFDGSGFSSSQPIPTGAGFENVGAASISGRRYQGVPVNAYGLGNGQPIIEMAFTGKLKGRTNRETFLGRLRAEATGRLAQVPGQRSSVVPFAQIVDEVLSVESELGLYRARGVAWPINANVNVRQKVGATIVDVIDPNTREVDNETGIITFTARTGGKVYFDTTLGTVRFAGTAPNRRAQILLTYTPRFVRVSAVGTANYQNPTLMHDDRFVNELDYWANPDLTAVSPNAQIRPGRIWTLLGRSASGAGETSRPYMASWRNGIQLVNPSTGRPVSLHTQPNGTITGLNLTGATSFIQVDPANGRIYFTAADEGRTINLNSFTYVDEATGNPVAFNVAQELVVRLIPEMSEAPISIEGAINESQIFGFIDPFDNPNPADRRPGMFWMFWTSTRGGAPDIYMQTLAPKLTPRARAQGGN